MCGGPSAAQNNAANAQANLSTQQAGQSAADSAITQPFFANEVANGNPYFNQQSQYSTSALGNQIDQAKAGLKSQQAGFGSALPSGFAASQDTDLAAQGAQAFDQNQLGLLQQQQATKQGGALALAGQGAGSASTAAGANSSIMNAPLQNNFFSNLVQGLISGGTSLGTSYFNNN